MGKEMLPCRGYRLSLKVAVTNCGIDPFEGSVSIEAELLDNGRVSSSGRSDAVLLSRGVRDRFRGDTAHRSRIGALRDQRRIWPAPPTRTLPTIPCSFPSLRPRVHRGKRDHVSPGSRDERMGSKLRRARPAEFMPT